MLNSHLLSLSAITAHTPNPASRHSTGWQALDDAMAGGWWSGALHELLGDGFGVGELSALLPTLAAATARRRTVALIHPPHQPYAPALQAAGIALSQLIVIEPKTTQAACWAAEHCLRALSDGVVLVWTQESQPLADITLRRLHRAAQLGGCIGIALRPPWAAKQPSPAPLRLRYQACEEGVQFECIKRRNAPLTRNVRATVPHIGLHEALHARALDPLMAQRATLTRLIAAQ
jgi:hypothetical protein